MSASDSPRPRAAGAAPDPANVDDRPGEPTGRAEDAWRLREAEDLYEGVERESDTGDSAGGAFTPCAGLFLLVPVIERLGIARWLADHPPLLDAGFPARLLAHLGTRTGLVATDPLCLPLDQMGGGEPLPPLTDWPDPVRALLATSTPRCPLDQPLDVWLTAARRWCRRRARIGLASIVRRPGRLLASRTHLEICFDLARADLRIRRAALDVDPGWVPWLGRVIRFHYVDPAVQRD